VAAVCQAGGLGILDLGVGDAAARNALEMTRKSICGAFGVRVGAGCRMDPADLRVGYRQSNIAETAVSAVDTVVLGRGAPWQPAELVDDYRVLVEVTDLDEALAAVDAGRTA